MDECKGGAARRGTAVLVVGPVDGGPPTLTKIIHSFVVHSMPKSIFLRLAWPTQITGRQKQHPCFERLTKREMLPNGREDRAEREKRPSDIQPVPVLTVRRISLVSQSVRQSVGRTPQAKKVLCNVAPHSCVPSPPSPDPLQVLIPLLLSVGPAARSLARPPARLASHRVPWLPE